MSAAQTGGRVAGSVYINWAKTAQSAARYNLANSGMRNYRLADLPVRLSDIELTGASFYGYPPLQDALARKAGVAAECVVAANGTSMANHLAMAALIGPGDEVLIEQPAYEPLLAAASYLGARVRRFARPSQNHFRLDAGEVERAITPDTKLVVVTNLHNPSNSLADDATLGEIGEAAKAVGARVLVDEVYLDSAFDAAPRSSFHLGENFVVTSSLTKAYGLSGLRCGWIVAAPELAQRMWRLTDLFGVVQPHATERLSVVALEHLDEIAASSRALLARNRALFNEFLAAREDLEVPPSEHGTVSFPRLVAGDPDRLCALLAQRYETSLVPGRFFEEPQHFRVGLALEPDDFKEGLSRLGAALDELKGAK
ncbi:MAG TPA: pyridoxal phosphate-dependent aminotransferase [Pyrinomonadaceae bacterium]|jgi:aspartate/methionine/tyrosine aminotransferase|nr:pyridoxal phosphate-dependent aminotransferase [Pyrinomonadaceae bacterium]